MYPALFRYHRPDSVQAAAELLSQFGDRARIMAGSQSVIPMIKPRMREASELVDIGRIPDLLSMKLNESVLHIGALTTHVLIAESEDVRKVPLIAQAASGIADWQIRSRGTIGGGLTVADRILGLMEKFRAEQNPNKVDLGVGVYKDEQGRTPVLDSVKQAEELVHQHEDSKGYIDPAGDPETNLAMQKLLLGEDSQALKDQRVATLQTPGGCGALSLAARMSTQANGESTVWVSNPTWENHLPLIGAAGMRIKEYSY